MQSGARTKLDLWLLTPLPWWVVAPFCVVLLFLRRPDALLHSQFWAEDGTVFFRGAYVDGWRSIFEPYAGYYHVLPRLIAVAARIFGPVAAPFVYSVSAFAVTLYTALLTQAPRSGLPRLPLLALSVVLVPDAFEVLLFLCQVQWFTNVALFLILVSRDPDRLPGAVHDVVAVVVFGLTGPASIICAPLFAWRALRRRTSASFLLAGLIVVMASIQVAQILSFDDGMHGHVDRVALLAVPGARIFRSLFVGSLPVASLGMNVDIGMTAITFVGLLGLTFRTGADREARIILSLGFVGLLIASLFRCRFVLPDLCNAGYGSRYFVPLQILALWLLCSAAVDGRRWVSGVMVAAFGWCVAVNCPRLREAPLGDEHWSQYAAALTAGRPVQVNINPHGWTVSLPEAPRRDHR